jgi:hypothetical protein
MKKALILSLAILISCMGLTGCKKDEDETLEEVTETEVTTVETILEDEDDDTTIETADPSLFVNDDEDDEEAGVIIVEYRETDAEDYEAKVELDENDYRLHDEELEEVEALSLTVEDAQSILDGYTSALKNENRIEVNKYNANQYETEDADMMTLDETNYSYWSDNIGTDIKVKSVKPVKDILTENGYDMTIIHNQYILELAYNLSGNSLEHRNAVGTTDWMFYNLTACEVESSNGPEIVLIVYVINDDSWRIIINGTTQETLEEYTQSLINNNEFVK